MTKATILGASAGRWRDLRMRFLSALVLGPATLVCIWLGGAPWIALIAIATAIVTWEWVRLCGLSVSAMPGMLLPAAVLTGTALAVMDRPGLGLALVAVSGVGVWLVGRRRNQGARPSRLFAAGIVYVGVAAIALIFLRDETEAGRANALFLFMVVWACDIGAYVAGRAVGGPKLAPAISPNKTWSGALGGVFAAVTVGVGVAWLLAPGGGLRAALIALTLAVAASAGDLLESAIKRRFSIKDSSGLIPGHGGLLDRMDGLIAAAPVAALIALALGQGHPLWR